tara:strand:+ start:204 stop:509 length:306 start_codon:yes stop_codon:yes gene_type:complete
MNIPISFWKTTDGQYSEKSWDQPVYSNEPNTAPESADYMTIRKEFEDSSGNPVDVTQEQATAIASYLKFKGDVRESKSGNSWRVYKTKISNSFDISILTAK